MAKPLHLGNTFFFMAKLLAFSKTLLLQGETSAYWQKLFSSWLNL
jgi:hypothetical protein